MVTVCTQFHNPRCYIQSFYFWLQNWGLVVVIWANEIEVDVNAA